MVSEVGFASTTTRQHALFLRRRPTTSAMNGYAPQVAQPVSVWQAAKAEDGREYYYNPTTKQTTWEKPDELKDEVEVRATMSAG